MSETLQIKISDVKHLLDEYEIEVESPDGWVPVESYVEKGDFQEYILHMENGDIIRCNENHLFETRLGWASAKECETFGCISYLTKSGYMRGVVTHTDNIIPIVDIKVDHPNHRYYTNNVSSHNTGGGKSLYMCSLASDYLKQGLNVLYITLELAEERVAERIDANLFNTPIQNLKDVELDSFMNKIDFLKSKTHGTLKIKEYPPSTVSAANFRVLIDDLKVKEDFVPDVCFVDYLGITASSRYKGASNVNSYTIQKAVAEELRAIAVEYNMVLWTAVQTNRSGFNASDFDLENISDSSGPSMSADLMLGIIRTPELDEMNQTMIKQLKNRFGALDYYRKFVVGIDRSRMKIYNVDESAQSNISKDVSDVRANNISDKPQLERYSKAKKNVSATDEWEF